jgi:hypothetical protein
VGNIVCMSIVGVCTVGNIVCMSIVRVCTVGNTCRKDYSGHKLSRSVYSGSEECDENLYMYD